MDFEETILGKRLKKHSAFSRAKEWFSRLDPDDQNRDIFICQMFGQYAVSIKDSELEGIAAECEKTAWTQFERRCEKYPNLIIEP